MSKLDPHFGQYAATATADCDNSISKIRAEVNALFWSAKILEQLKDPSSSMQRTDLRGLAKQMRETADTLDRVVDRVESPFWTAAE
jgi:hypothetical protein